VGRPKKARIVPRRAARPVPRAARPPWRTALVVLWWAAAAFLLVITALGVERKITWYLAVDQYGYLAFAHDLASGRIFHHWRPLDALGGNLPPRVDVMAQTYIWDAGRLYCRYAPGFPLLMAGWLLLFGDDGIHFLNPSVFIALLALVIAFQLRLLRSRWRALVGAALVVLFPTMLHLWALTLVRDLSAHLFALFGLYLLLPVRGRRLTPGRTAAAGVALGYAGTIRPDAVLYLFPATLVALARWHHERTRLRPALLGIAAGLLGVVLGLGPFLGYNWLATGNPLRPTQGMEIDRFLPGSGTPAPNATSGVGFPPGAWRGGTLDTVQGGGLRLENLPHILPGNISLLRQAYGDLLLGIALWGACLAFVRRRLLFLATVPYAVLAMLFFSCWARPDPRYLSGIYILLPMLIVEGTLGTLDLVRRLVRRDRESVARGIAFAAAGALLAGAVLFAPPSGRTALPMLAAILPFVGGAAALAQATWSHRRVALVAAPLLALMVVGLAGWRSYAGMQSRATFQRDEMLRARATFARAVERGAVVITSEDVGRPAENIDYYSGVANALYLTDLQRWRLNVPYAAGLLLRHRIPAYLLVPSSHVGREELLGALGKIFEVERVATIPPGRAIDYFVAAPFHRGVEMELYRIRHRNKRLAPRS
jgi:4-amino-4-deoxy-L-arabinose transferase-like glycosyltransferase